MLRLKRDADARADLRAGVLVATIANVNRKPGAPAFQPHDYFPHLKPKERVKTAEEQEAALDRIFGIGRDKSVIVTRERRRTGATE